MQTRAHGDVRHGVGSDEGGAGTPTGSDRPLGEDEEPTAKARQRSACVPGQACSRRASHGAGVPRDMARARAPPFPPSARRGEKVLSLPTKGILGPSSGFQLSGVPHGQEVGQV